MAADRKGPVRVLGVLQVLIGLGAVPAGLSMILDPSGAGLGMTLEALDGSPFPNYLVPGLFLLAVNGLGSLIGAATTFGRRPLAHLIAIALGAFLMAWIVVQIMSLGPPIHWLQAVYFVLGAVELFLGWQMAPGAARGAAQSR